MGSGSSCMASGPSPPLPQPKRSKPPTKRSPFISSLLLCGCSSPHATREMEDDPSELLVNSAEYSDPNVKKLQSTKTESSLISDTGSTYNSPRTGSETSFESSKVAGEDSVFGDASSNVETSTHQLSADHSSSNTNSTCHVNQHSSQRASASERIKLDVCDDIDNSSSSNASQFGGGASQPIDPVNGLGGSSLNADENHAIEVLALDNSDSGSNPSLPSLLRDIALQELAPSGLGFLVSEREQDVRDENVLHLDMVSISSNVLSGGANEVSNHEARQNGQRLFWDAFSRRSSRRPSDSRNLVFSPEDSGDLGSHDRWLVDHSGDIFNDASGSDSGDLGTRTRGNYERHWNSRSEFWERLHGGLGGNDHHASCPSGLHPDGACSCESILMSEESGTHASISRIVMLAEALFEVLDEIHLQPVSLSLSMVSLPAPEVVVDSFPVRNHRKSDTAGKGDDVAQCYVCLSEYEEGDKIRVLPCHHEFHLSCVDKWLKEIHGVCPLCRGEVCEGFTEGSTSSSLAPVHQ